MTDNPLLELAMVKIRLDAADPNPDFNGVLVPLTRGECRALYAELHRLRAALQAQSFNRVMPP